MGRVREYPIKIWGPTCRGTNGKSRNISLIRCGIYGWCLPWVPTIGGIPSWKSHWDFFQGHPGWAAYRLTGVSKNKVTLFGKATFIGTPMSLPPFYNDPRLGDLGLNPPRWRRAIRWRSLLCIVVWAWAFLQLGLKTSSFRSFGLLGE